MNNEVVPHSHYPRCFQRSRTRLCCWNGINLPKKSRGKSMPREVVKALAFAALSRVHLSGAQPYKDLNFMYEEQKEEGERSYWSSQLCGDKNRSSSA